MLDLEKAKNILQSEINNREKAKSEWEQYRASNETYLKPVADYLESVAEKTYIKYRSRFNGMCDILYEMGYLVLIDDDNSIRVESRIFLDNVDLDDEFPF